MYTRPSYIGNYNIRKGFLDKGSIISSELNSDFDEPTYLSFKLNFYSDESLTDRMTYDTIPQALFSNPGSSWMDWTSDEELREKINNYSYNPKEFVFDRSYNAFRYLLDKNEDFRAFLLAKFLKGWNELQEQYQFYFQSVSGIDKLFESNPLRGSKLSKDTIITVECLEAIDQRVKYLLSLYRAAAWDDEYQRWILPDIYRYFKMDIFISEIRTFHRSNLANQSSALNLISNTATNLMNKAMGCVNSKINDWTGGGLDNKATVDLLTLGVVNDICPVTCLHCEMCDFDISSSLYESQYDINNSNMEKTVFKIRVKKVEPIYNWTLIDRIFGNLLNNTERGKKSMTASQGWRDYLGKSAHGPLSQDVFNNTILLSDSDKKHNYSNYITGGWISRTLNKTLDATNGILGGGSVIDLAADIYTTVRSSIADAKSNKDIDTISKATDHRIGDIKINEIKGILPNTTIVDEAFKEIAAQTPTQDQILQTVMDLLKESGTKFKDLTLEQQEMVQKSIDAMNLVDMKENTKIQSKDDRSWATDIDGAGVISKYSLLGATDVSSNFVPIDQKEINFSMNDDSIIKKNLNKKEGLEDASIIGGSIKDSQMPIVDSSENSTDIALSPIPQIKDRSWATDLDGTEPSMEMTPMDTEDDRSWATNLDGMIYDPSSLTQIPQNNDRSLATDLDGLKYDTSIFTSMPQVKDKSWATDLDGTEPSMEMTPIDINDEKKITPLISISQPKDRSWATDLDGSEPSMQMTDILQVEDKSWATDLDGTNPEMEMTSIPQVKDKSWATDLDGSEPSMQMKGIEQNKLNLNLKDPHIQTEEDKSWATDLDGTEPSMEMTPMNTEDDRSWATDLDGLNSSKMSEIKQSEIDLKLSEPHIQTEEDKSWATDLDGINIPNMPKIVSPEIGLELTNPNLQIEEDRSLATDLDGIEIPNLISVQNSDINLELIDPNIQTEDDKSWATDLDDTPSYSMPSIEQNNINIELTNVHIQEEPDRSLATDLDGQMNTSEMSSIEQNDINIELNDVHIQTEEDKSWATDLDGIINQPMPSIEQSGVNIELVNPNIQSEDDRSLATDLDGQMNTSIPSIEQSGVNIELTNPNIQTEDDKSWATDLDGTPSYSMPNIEQNDVNIELQGGVIQNEEDRSQATDLDGLGNSTMQEIIQSEQNFELNSVYVNSPNPNLNINKPQLQEELDKSFATDLDNSPSLTQPLSLFEQIARSQATINSKITGGEVDESYQVLKTQQLVILPNGQINPEATVGDILEQYSDILKQTNKKSQLQNVEIVGDTSKRTEIISSSSQEEPKKQKMNMSKIKKNNKKIRNVL